MLAPTDIFYLEFESKWVLCLLALIPLIAFIQFRTLKKSIPILKMPSVAPVKSKLDWVQKLRWLLAVLRLLCLFFLIIAIARPRAVNASEVINNNKGVDIILAVDVSGSMDGNDMYPTRLEALKEVAIRFVEGRRFDRIGLVIYAGEAFNKIPLTTDRSLIINSLTELKSQELNGGTAIGNGLGTAVNHLKNSKAKSKIIILMTDGINNDGFIDPQVASEIAAHYHIRVYTIGLGSEGIDEPLMKTIAKNTGAFYFRATNTENLKNIYDEIDKMEKTEINDIKYYRYKEYFKDFLCYAFILLALEILARLTLFKSFI